MCERERLREQEQDRREGVCAHVWAFERERARQMRDRRERQNRDIREKECASMCERERERERLQEQEQDRREGVCTHVWAFERERAR